MSKKLAVIIIILNLIIVAIGYTYIKLKPVPDSAEYVGSGKCQSCHLTDHTNWSTSLHTKMMRKVNRADVVVADLKSEAITFHINDAVWAIGGKWEQQFMGEEDGAETLLPGAWLVSQ